MSKYLFLSLLSIGLLISCTSTVSSLPAPTPSASPHASSSPQPVFQATRTITPTQASVEIELKDTGLQAGGWGNLMHFSNPVWSNDGKMLAYKRDFDILIVPVGQWDQAQVVYGPIEATNFYFEPSPNLVWSPDDTQVGFTWSELALDGYAFQPLLGRYDREKDEGFVLLEGEAGILVDWSTEGVIVCHYSENGCAIVDLTSGERHELGQVISPFFVNDHQVIYGDDGAIVLFDWRANEVDILEGIQTSQETTPFVYRDDGTTVVANEVDILEGQTSPETTHLKLQTILVPSPDGNLIVWTDVIEEYTASSGKTRSLMLYDRSTGEAIEILNDVDFPHSGWSLPSWSPDSQKLAFEAGGTIWIMSLRFPEP